MFQVSELIARRPEAKRPTACGVDLRHLLFVALASVILLFGFIGQSRAAVDTWEAGLPGGRVITGTDACTVAQMQWIDVYSGYYRRFDGCIGDGRNEEAIYDCCGTGEGYSFLITCAQADTFLGCQDPTVPPGKNSCPAQSSSAQPGVNSVVGDPINPLTGKTEEHIVDYSSAGPDPLTYERYYSNNGRPLVDKDAESPLARGWRSNFDATMTLDASYNVNIILPNGREIRFRWAGGSIGFLPATVNLSTGDYDYGLTGVPEGLTVVNPGSSQQLKLATGDGKVYVFSDTAATPYHDTHLVEIDYRGGYVQTPTYASGVMTGVTDNRGRSLSFTLDSYNHITEVDAGTTPVAQFSYLGVADTSALIPYESSFPGGVIPAEYAYAVQVLQTVTYPTDSSNTITYGYTDANNNVALTSLTDERGIVYSTWTYDSTGRTISSEHAGSTDLTGLSYNDPSHQVTVTNPLSKQAVITYTAGAGGRKLPTSVEGEVSTNCPYSDTTATYDSNDFLSQLTDAEGRVTTFTNDAATGLPTSITRGYGSASASTSTYSWNTTWYVPTQIVDPGLTTDLTWATNGQLSSVTETDTTSTTSPYSTNGQTRTWGFTYDSTGLLLTADGPLSGSGDTTTYTYDASGFLSTITDSLSHVTTVNSVNDRGQPTSVTDGNGIITALDYDGRGRLKSISVDTAGTPSTTTVTYDLAGDVTKITEPNGAYESYTYDDARRLTTVTNNAGETINYVRDAMGNATSITVKHADTSTAYTKSQVFDELGRLIQSIGASSQTFNLGYDKTDNLTSIEDPRSHTFSYGFDALNRLIQETDEDSNAVNLTRNGTDHITTYTDPRSLATTYVRNGFGEIIEENSPDKGTTVYVRDARGLVTQRADPRSIVTNYTYDDDGRLLTQSYVGSSADNVTYTWDGAATGSYPVGYLTSISDASGTTSRRYDAQGRIFDESRTIASASADDTQYTYDASGNVATITYPSGRIVTYTRDSNGHVSSISTKASATSSSVTIASSVTWQPWGAVSTLAFGNGLTATFGTDTDYRVSSIVVAPTSGSHLVDRSLSWTGETLDSITDNLTSANSEAFTYTPARRLNGATGAYGTLGWTYDAVGNRASQTDSSGTSTYNHPTGSNQLSSIVKGATTLRAFGYDAAGDINSDANSSFTWTYGFDVEGRLSSAMAGTTSKGAYTYDALWRLARRVVTNTTPSGETHFIHDLQNHIIAETDSTGATTREYIWLDDLPVAAVDDVSSSPVIYFVHTDHLYRPVAMTDGSASVVWSVIYKPFGEVQSITGTPVLDMRFPGQWFQLETGLHYNWHRHYDPTLGRYIQPDPLGIDEVGQRLLSGVLTNSFARVEPISGPSIYGYADQSPTTRTDTTGLLASFVIPSTAPANSLDDDGLCDAQNPEGRPLIQPIAQSRRTRPGRCQSVICGTPRGDATPPLCNDCATKLLNGTPTLLENGTLLPPGTNLFPPK